jgi:hypothetical protein
MKLATIIFISLFACSVATESAQDSVTGGVWGGKGIQLTLTDSGGTIDYGCDSGTIEGRLRTDSHGRFVARGTHVFGTGGPRSPGDAAPKSHAARYEGVRKGDRMELTVELPELKRTVGKFTLRRGQRPTLERCG